MKTHLSNTMLNVAKYLVLAALTIVCLHSGAALAAGNQEGLTKVAQNVTDGMTNLAKLITAVSFVMGFGFAAAAILKFKAHKDNPAQIPVGTPIALLFIAAALIYLPSLYQSVGKTIFGSEAHAGSASGITDPENKGGGGTTP